MTIKELGYFLVGAPDVEEWRQFATGILGAMAIDGPDGALYLKIDERAFRIAVLPGRENGLGACGWLAPDPLAFEEARQALLRDGTEIQPGDADGARLRCVQEYFGFRDPADHWHELAWGPISDHAPFASPIGVSGFVTAGLGLGHVVLAAAGAFDETLDFWVRPGRFALSDILHVTMPHDEIKRRVHFLHCDNPRQHSLAFGEIPMPGGCLHIMLEVASLDDVGRCLDRVKAAEIAITATLGRHVNDDMTSFYFKTPAGFAIEYGTGGKQMDWSNHSAFETTRGSHWGHDRS